MSAAANAANRSPLAARLAELTVECVTQHVTLVLDGEWPHDEWRVAVAYKEAIYHTVYKTGLGHRKLAAGVTRERGGYAFRDARGAPGFAKTDKEAMERGLAQPVAPAVADVVSSLLTDAQGSDQPFDDWCSDLGYSTDSIKARDTYFACQRERVAMVKMFGAGLFAELTGLEH